MKKAVVVFSGGLDSVCTCAYLKSKYQLYGISFSYGQRANQEIRSARRFTKILGFSEHKIVDIGFMKDLYGTTNVLTNPKQKLPSQFEYSIVVPIRNAVFLLLLEHIKETNIILIADLCFQKKLNRLLMKVKKMASN